MPSMPNNAPQQVEKKRLVIFVHGFGSSPNCWKRFHEIFLADPAVADKFQTELYGYPSRWFEFSILRRLPSVRQVAEDLAARLGRQRFDYDEITLVGHSQGGLVIQRCLLNLLHSTNGEPVLERIRQVILIATPNLGSTTVSPVRRFLSHFYFFNQQERSLRVFDEEIDTLRKELQEKVVETDRRTAETWPIPVQCFYGLGDRIVPEASARGPYLDVEALDGDHFSLIRPSSRHDERYCKVRHAILEPAGHWRIWDIDSYKTEIRVEPYRLREYRARVGRRVKIILTDSFARVDRSVTFSRRNRCHERFPIPYRTRDDGFLEGFPSTENEADPAEIARYHDYGVEYLYAFTPEAGQAYHLNLKVYKGFEPGHRDAHFHLGQKCLYKRYICRLDLSAYLKEDQTLTQEPQLYYHPRDPSDHGICERRESGRAITCIPASTPGIWEWNLFEIRDGVIDLVWEAGDRADGASCETAPGRRDDGQTRKCRSRRGRRVREQVRSPARVRS